MAKSKFDLSLLKPVDEENSNFQANLQPVEEESQEDEGAYLDNLPPPEGFWKKLPRNLLIGLAKLGHSTVNLPHDLVAGVENAGESFGNSINKAFPLPKEVQERLDKMPKHKPFKLSEHIYEQPDYDYAGMLGQEGEGTLMDKLIQGGVEYAPEIASGRALLKAGLRKFPITKRGAARQLKEAEKQVKNLGVPNIPLSNQTIDEAVQFLPKTHATRELLKAAEAGEYSPSFSLQSQIGKHERDLRKSPLAAERLLAPQARDLKMRVLSEMETGLRAHGYNDIADMMKGGINDYRKYIKFRDTVLPVLKKIGIPTTALAVLGVGVKKGKQIARDLVD